MLDAVLELTYSSWGPAKLLAVSVHEVCSHAHAVLWTFCGIDRRKGFSLLVTGAVRPKLHHTHVHPHRLRFQQEYILGYYTPSLSTPSPSPHTHSPPPSASSLARHVSRRPKGEIYKLFQSATCDNYLCCTRTLAAVVVSRRGSIK